MIPFIQLAEDADASHDEKHEREAREFSTRSETISEPFFFNFEAERPARVLRLHSQEIENLPKQEIILLILDARAALQRLGANLEPSKLHSFDKSVDDYQRFASGLPAHTGEVPPQAEPCPHHNEFCLKYKMVFNALLGDVIANKRTHVARKLSKIINS